MYTNKKNAISKKSMQNRKNIQTCDNNDGGIMLKLEQTEQNKKEGHPCPLLIR